ncbi:N-acetyltransferase ESCO2-like [Haliotis cracherodii]|uniref:N-acetyltransferase ESCO2-like n=1 Tax=Haliotis cracherodii TaxID=6455 RepID=UPI0039EBF318
MATYNMRRKRKLHSSPDKKKADIASPRKRLRTKSVEPSTPSSPIKSPFADADADSPTFATKSFYGSRLKIASSPSSSTSNPVVVLSPLAEKKLANIRGNTKRLQKGWNDGQTSSENGSPSSQGSGYSRRSLRNKDQNDKKSHVVKGNLVQGKETPVKGRKRKITVTKNAKGSLTPSLRKIDPEDSENTPLKQKKMNKTCKSSGKKFFRTKSPANADKMVGSIVVRKGFNLKFVPKRLSGNLWEKSTKSKSAKKGKKTPQSKYPKLKMKASKSLKEDAFLWESEPSSGENTDISTSGKSKSKPFVMTKKVSSPPRTIERKVFASHVKLQNCKQTKSPAQSEVIMDKVVKTPTNINSDKQSVVKTSKLRKSFVVVNKCDVEIDGSPGSVDSFLESSPTSVSLISEPFVSRKTESLSGSHDLFGFDSLMGDDIETSRPPSVYSDKSATPTKEISSEEKKFFSIFDPKKKMQEPQSNSSSLSTRRSLRSSPRSSPGFKFTKDTDGMEQMIIDAGQKKIGAIQCETCNMLYNQGDPSDEADHAKIHLTFMSALSFPGWKKERVVQEFPDDGGRIVVVLSQDPKYATKKVEEINRLMSMDLGFPEQTVWYKPHLKVFLYVSDEKEVQGCVVAESITEGYRVIPESQGGGSQVISRTGRPWCCETEPEPALVGISRLWVCNMYRRKGIASRLVDTVRQVFEHGVLIDKDEVAFSDPTTDGKQFATKYSATPAFLVYKYM